LSGTATRIRLAKRQASVLGKLTRPRPVGALLRERLFHALDEARARPAVWLTGAPGAGKTTLVSTYAAQRRLRTVWYRVTAEDADPATFFHYLRMAIAAASPGRHASALPDFTPEYLPELGVFSRRYFEEVYRRLKAPCALVLDNYQEVAADAALHEVLRAALESLPAGMNVIVMSRSEPPPALAPLRARGTLALLGGEALHLTPGECASIARLRDVRIEQGALHRLHERTHGWAAGVVLALEQKTLPAAADAPPSGATPQVVFDYFAGDIFGKMSVQTQALLLRAAFLPGMAGDRVVELTGDAQAGRVLGELARSNYFTLKLAQVHGAPPAVYQFHPLFREFLLRRAEETLAPETLVAVKKKAAALLEADGETTDAVALLLEACAWDEALRIVFRHAAQILQQGRGRVLEKWLRALPLSLLEESPWALYWLGRCRLGYDPVEARRHLEAALRLFEEAGTDATGLYSAWAAIVDTFVFEWGDFAPLDYWIGVLDRRLAGRPPVPAEVEARVAFGMFTALMYRQPYRADLPLWAERVRALAVNAPDGRTQMLLGNQLMHYYTSWAGNVGAARLLLEAVRPPANAAEFGPLAYIAWCAMEADYYWHTDAHDECLRSVEKGLEAARQTGARFATSRLQAHGIMGSIMAGDFATAERLLKEGAAAISGGRVVYRAHYHFLGFLNAFYQRDHAHAVLSAREAVALSDVAGVPICQALYRLGLAHALFSRGERREALRYLAQARRITRRMRIATTEFSCLSTTTFFLLERGKRRRALPLLRKTLQIARQRGYINRAFWTPDFMTRLFGAALEHGIEVEYVQDTIRRRGLAPPPDALYLERWPFPLRIRTLGRFSVLIDGRPLAFSGKAQRKPLELLMALIAFGGRDVSERQLTEALWPDAEGDAAHQACAAALHRLRKLLDCDEAITLQHNHFSLNPRHVWVDAWAFERALAAPDGKSEALYQGPFLGTHPDLPWAISLRERLRAKFMRHLAERGRVLFEAGEHAAAIALFEKGLSADPLAEDFYRQIMSCYHALGLRAEAICVYQRCEKTLAAALGLAPAAKTVALYQKLQS
jgi:LuxR family transcriptional regulator, maltose regulon positive regulatory protein